jgi:hypothetical protein
MRINLEQFHGSRPRVDARLLNRYEAQIADNCRLWSGKLSAWRRPSSIRAVGTNSLRWSNELSNALWLKSGCDIQNQATTGPDGSLTADKIIETGVIAMHGVSQSVAKATSQQTWTASSSLKAAERSFALVVVADGAGNYCGVGANLSNGTLGAPFQGGTSALPLSVSIELDTVPGWYRVTVVAAVSISSTVKHEVYSAIGTGYADAGTLGSAGAGVFHYGASLRRANAAGAYRETTTAALDSIRSIRLYKGIYWLTSSERAHWVKGPVQGDTTDALYFTGGNSTLPSVTYDPLVYNGGSGRGDMPRQAFTMGLPAPGSPPLAATTPQTGAITAVGSEIVGAPTQLVSSFSIPPATVDGSEVIAQCNFKTTLQTENASNIVVNMKITRGARTIAEAERKISLQLEAGVTQTEIVEALLSGADEPSAGSAEYTCTVTVSVSSGILTSLSYEHTRALVRYRKTRITVGAGHPFAAGDYIAVANVTGYEAVNSDLLLILGVGTTYVDVDVESSEIYTGGGTWTRAYAEESVQDTAWLVTFVTQVGSHEQEGPPSQASNIVKFGPGQSAQLTSIPTAPPGDGGTYNITAKRIYRSNVLSGGDANWQFVAEIPLAQSVYDDSKRAIDLGEVLPSEFWVKPPADLHGLVSMQNGVLAGISSNQVCFSEPFQPHAWPISYRISIDYVPQALATFGGGNLLVMTLGKPSVVVGFEPENFRLEPQEIAQPCVSIDGVVDMGDFVIYPGDDGLVLVSSSNVQLVTRELFTKDEWQQINPDSLIASEYDSRYVAFFTRDDGTQGGFIFDPREPTSTLTWLDFYASAAWTNPATGDLYLVIGESIVNWHADPYDRYSYRWRSRRFVLNTPICPAYALVIAEDYPVDFTLLANTDPEKGDVVEEVHVETVAGAKAFTLPAGYLSDTFEIELRGDQTVKRVCIATSIEELSRQGD